MRDWVQAPLSYVIRFFFPGVVLIIYLYLYDPEKTWAFINGLGATATIVLCGLTGTFIYLIYRPLVYNVVITRFQDRVMCCGSENYRKYFQRLYGTAYRLGMAEKQLLYQQVKREETGPYPEEMLIVASSIHLLYISALLNVIWFFIWLTTKGGFSENKYFMIALIIVGILFSVTGLFSDKYHERVELGLIYGVTRLKLDSIVRQLFPNNLIVNNESK